MSVNSRWALVLATLCLTPSLGQLSAQDKAVDKPATKKPAAKAATKPGVAPGAAVEASKVADDKAEAKKDEVKKEAVKTTEKKVEAKKAEPKKEEVKKEEAPKKEAPKKETTKKEAPKKGADGEEEKPADPFAVPKDAKPAELIAFIQQLASRRPNFKTPDEQMAHFKKIGVAVMEATELALAAEEIEDEVAESALMFRFQALNLQRNLEIEGVDKLELELAEKYSADKRPKLAAMAKEKLLFARLRNVKELKAEEQEALLEEALTVVKGDGKLSRRSVQVAMQVGNALEEGGNEALAATAFEKFSEIFSHDKDENLATIGVKFQGTARRLRLPGSELEIEGDLVDGKPFDWSAYKGKVVLVDFWATWCGPCIAELPNVKQNYNGYHSKGFDVVGISLDDDHGALKGFIKKRNIPWQNLFSADEKATGWEHPLAVKYGVMGIPFTILVGKDGKVIAMNVRGPKLGEALAKELGEPDEEALKAAAEAEAKAEQEAAEEAKKAAAKEEPEEDAKPAAKKPTPKKAAKEATEEEPEEKKEAVKEEKKEDDAEEKKPEEKKAEEKEEKPEAEEKAEEAKEEKKEEPKAEAKEEAAEEKKDE